MKLKKLSLKNIRSYESQTVEFPEGAVLLAGDVGAGKTTLLLAIEYALFGLQPGQKGSALLRNNESSGEVVLECEIDGQDIVIERHLKRESKSITSDYAALTLNNETREYSVTELKSKILELLGYPGEFIKKNNLLYRYTVYTPQEQMKQIIVEDTETRLNVLRHVFGIDKYKHIRENLTLLLNRFKEEAKVLQGEVKSLEQDKTCRIQTKNRILTLEADYTEKATSVVVLIEQRKSHEQELIKIESKVREKEHFEREVEKTKILIAVKQESHARYLAEEREITQSITESGTSFDEQAYAALCAQLNTIRAKIDALQTQHVALVSQRTALEQAQRENSLKRERIFKIEMCPTCLQDVPEAHKHNILNETEQNLTKARRESSLLMEQEASIKKEVDMLKKELQNEEQKKIDAEIKKSREMYIERSRRKLVDVQQQQEILGKDIILLTQHVTKLKEEILAFSKFETQYRLKNEELKRAFAAEKNAEIAIAELKKELELTRLELVALNETIHQKELLEKKLAKLSEVIDWGSNQFLSLINFTETQVMMKLRREFSRIFSKWFQMIAGEAFEVQLDESFTPIIVQGEVEMEYSFLSGGERTAVALAYRLALNQTINSVLSQIKTKDIVILDEPTDGFSEAQIDKIRDVLQELKVTQLIIVSHEQKIESFVDNIIRLKKTQDASTIDIVSLPASEPTVSEPEMTYPKT